MTGDEYLYGLLRKYTVNIFAAKSAAQTILPIIQRWGSSYLAGVEFSGSLAKGTGISNGTDADLFISMSSLMPVTLGVMYQSLYDAIAGAGYSTRKQNVSIGVAVNGYSIDLVPGRRQSQYGNDHSLYRNKVNSWTQTNVITHISYVKGSGRVDEIRIIKLWRNLHNLEFPSFFLEMAVIDALKYTKSGNLAANVLKALEYIGQYITSVKYIDPANTNNVVSGDCTVTEKQTIAALASKSRKEPAWESIVW